MLIPKVGLYEYEVDGQMYVCQKYYVYDTDKDIIVKNRSFGVYDSPQECQKDIDFFNSFEVIKVS